MDLQQEIARFRPSSLAVGRVVGAALIAYAFIIVLITASSQSRVAAQLQRATPPLDYSKGYLQWQERITLQNEVTSLIDRRSKLITKMAGLTTQIQSQKDQDLEKQAPLRMLSARLSSIADCKIPIGGGSAGEIAEVITTLQYCLYNSLIPDGARDTAKSALKTSQELLSSARATSSLEHDLMAAGLDRTNITDDIADHRKQMASLDKVGDAFSELNVVQKNVWLGGALLTSFSPAIIQIFLAFLSGLFGALLVTLVIIVYPNNKFDFSTPEARTAPRILLGGLISLCVFVVLGGGTAVLGKESPFDAGDTNFLAFCAIGILSGMFSDRVAFWLSERAETIFQRKDEASAKAEAAAAASETAKQAADAAAAVSAEAAEAAAARASSEAAKGHGDEGAEQTPKPPPEDG